MDRSTCLHVHVSIVSLINSCRHYCLVIKVEKLTTPSNVKNKSASYHEYTVNKLVDNFKVVFILNKLPRR